MFDRRLLALAAAVAVDGLRHLRNRHEPFSPANPFANASPLPYQAPPFDKIHDDDYQPAIEEGMRVQLAEVARIAADTAAPTFDNTIVALEKTGALLTRANNVVPGDHAGEHQRHAAGGCRRRIAPKLAAHDDAIHLNAALFARVKALHDRRAALGLDSVADVPGRALLPGLRARRRAALRLRQDEASRAERGGIEARHRVPEPPARGDEGRRRWSISDTAELAGLERRARSPPPPRPRRRASSTASGCSRCRTRRSSRARRRSRDRATRERLFRASTTRTEHGDSNDTRALVLRLAQLRAERARLLGFPNLAAYVARRPDGEDAGPRDQAADRHGPRRHGTRRAARPARCRR